MRRFLSASYLGLAAIFLFTAVWSGCGGGSSKSNVNQIVKFVFSPTIISLEPGQVVTVGATAYNASNTAVTTTITFTSSDPNNGAISPGGSLCGGSWDATYTTCTPGTQVGPITITATANDNNKTTGTTTAYVHLHVDAVYAHAPSAACTSAGKTSGMTAIACTSKANAGGTCSTVCPDNANMCDISGSVGGFNYGVLDPTVATIASDGTITGGTPGITKIYASVTSGTSVSTSAAVPYTTCLVDSISLHVKDKTDTSLTVAKSSTASLAADVLDTAGNSISATLTYNDAQSIVGSTAAGSPATTGTYTGKAPGYGAVVASCTPPNCNKNASSVFSNVVTTTVQNSSSDAGVTANETNVYVTGKGAQQMYPVDTTTHTLGTVMSLPYTPNSIAISRDGAKIFLGSDTAGMVISTGTNSVQALSFPGKVLAVSPNNAYVLFASSSSVYIMSGSSLTIANPGGFALPNVKAASFTPDGNTVYFTDGSHIFRYRVVGDSGSTPTPLTVTNGGGSPLPGTASDLATSANGSIIFSATSPKIVADESCNTFNGTAYVTAFDALGSESFTAPSQLEPLPNGSGMLAVDGGHLDQITITNPNPLTAPFTGCPATGFTTSQNTISLSALGGATINQLLVSPSGHYAAVLASNGQVAIVDLTNGNVNAVSLVNKGSGSLGNVYSGGWMLDDSGVWVGASDSYIHFVDVASLTDKAQVQVQIQGPPSGGGVNFVAPSLVVVQAK